MANTPVSVRLADETRTGLDKLARLEDRSLNYLINKLLVSALEARGVLDARAKARAK